MSKDKIQQIVVNKLLDKYEKSKTFTGDNQVKQSFNRKVSELFPKYNDDAEYDLFVDVNEALRELEQLNMISLGIKRGDIINTVSLNTDMLSLCYDRVRREPKRDENQWLMETMESFKGNVILDKYLQAQKEKLIKNQKVEYYDGNKTDYIDLLRLVITLLTNESEQYVRELSIKLFNDSKRVEKLESKARALLYQYGDFLEKESVFEECSILKTPTYVSVKGKATITIGKQQIDLSLIEGDIALSTESLKSISEIKVTGKRIVTVENLTSFHDYSNNDDFVIYLGGFHNKTKRCFLSKVYESNKDKEYRHFGDIDAGGFYILLHLRAKTAIEFTSLYMDIATIEKYKYHTKEITENDRKRLESLLKKDIGTDSDVIDYMLINGCKLEQEAVKV